MKPPRSAHDYALALLSARAYTVSQLGRKLQQKGYDRAENDRLLSRFVESGLLDDRRYALEFARQKIVAGGALRRVRLELARKGIAEETIEEAVRASIESEPVDQSAAIDRLIEKKLASLAGLDPRSQRRRIFGFLARKGYEIDDINSGLSRHSL